MSSLDQLVIAHHLQAFYIARKTLRQRPYAGTGDLDELRKVGRKFTTRVEKRLRKLGGL